MNEMKNKLPRLSLLSVILTIGLGVLVAASVYQVQLRGWLPSLGFNPPGGSLQQTRVVVNEENAIISVAKKVSPSVVAIGITRQSINFQESTIGTGFVVSDKGVIVTNKHVVSDTSATYTVVTKDGQKYEVNKIYRDPILDLAIVSTNATGLKPVEIGDSSKLEVGQTAIAIGNALGQFTNSVTTGIVSGLGRKVSAGDPLSGASESLDNLIQTDAAINPGNSGGPLLNSAGQVIGVDVATTEGAQNIGFAIPINTVKPIIDEFLQKGSVTRPYLGIRYRFISKDIALLNEVPQGAYIAQVIAGGPADKAGVRDGDIITKMNNQSIDGENKLSDLIAGGNVGKQVSLEVWRNGKTINLTATLENIPSQ